MRYPIQVLTLGEILDQGIVLVRNHARLLFGISAVLLLPYQLINSWLAYMCTPTLTGRSIATMVASNPHPLLGILSSCLSILFFLVISPITNAATTVAVSDEYLGRPTSIRQSFTKALQRLVPLIWTTLIATFLIMLGFICLIIPGLILSLQYALTTQVVILEDKSGMEALRRSKQLMDAKGHWGTWFCISFVLVVASFLLGLGAGFVPGALFRGVSLAVVQTATVIVWTTIGAVFYFSCRCKVENFDLDMLAGEMEREETPALTSR